VATGERRRAGSWLRVLVMSVLVRAWDAPLCVFPWMFGVLPAIHLAAQEPATKPSELLALSAPKSWRPPIVEASLWLRTEAPTKEDADGEVYRAGCARGKHDVRGDWGERQAARVARRGDQRPGVGGADQDDPGKRHVALEEGTQSTWVYEILSPHAEEMVVAAVSESRGQKSDERDAFHLAEQLRTGAIKRKVFKESGEFRTLRELSRTHQMVVQDSVRVQNRIKALFRSRGVPVSGKGVYSETGREKYLEQLPDASRGAAARSSRACTAARADPSRPPPSRRRRPA
jgi:hypothetical protein